MLNELLTRERIVPRMQASEHWAAIVELLDHLIAIGKFDGARRDECLDALRRREALTSTGIGSGVAIPHAFLDGLEKTQAAFGLCPQGIEFDSLDAAPVQMVLLFLVPRAHHAEHLRTLASVARTLSSVRVRREVLEARTPAAILSALTPDPAPVPLGRREE